LQAKMANERAAGGSAPYDGAADGYGGRARDEEDEPTPGPRQQERNKCRLSALPQRSSGGNDEWGRIKHSDKFNFMRTAYDDVKCRGALEK
jgi:hypothetical protein